MPVKEIGPYDDFNQILNQHSKVIVDCFADWCGPCKQIAPFFAEQSNNPKYKNIVFLKVNVDDHETFANKYNIQSLPTFMTFKNGALAYQAKGASQDNITKLLKDLAQ